MEGITFLNRIWVFLGSFSHRQFYQVMNGKFFMSIIKIKLFFLSKFLL